MVLAARGESLLVAVRTDSARLLRRRSLEYLGYSALRCSLHPDRIRLERLGPLIPMGRAGRADEIASVALFLLSAQASYVTGAIIDVGGGR